MTTPISSKSLVPGESRYDLEDAFPDRDICYVPLFPGAYLSWQAQTWGTLQARIHHAGDRSIHGRRIFVIQRETSRRDKKPRWELHHWCDGVRKLVSRQYESRLNAIEGAMRFALKSEHR